MINITDAAKNYIKQIITQKENKKIAITLKKGGCAGNILVIELCDSIDIMCNIKIEDLDFYMLPEVYEIAVNNELLIDIKQGLNKSIIIRNKTAKNICKCGKSFGN